MASSNSSNAADPAKVAQVIEFAKQARNLGALGRVRCKNAGDAERIGFACGVELVGLIGESNRACG